MKGYQLGRNLIRSPLQAGQLNHKGKKQWDQGDGDKSPGKSLCLKRSQSGGGEERGRWELKGVKLPKALQCPMLNHPRPHPFRC